MKKHSYHFHQAILQSADFQEKQDTLQYLLGVFRHFQFDLEQGLRDHFFDLEASLFWEAYTKALLPVQPEFLVIAPNSLFAQNEPENFYYLNLLDQLNRQGLYCRLLTSDLGANKAKVPVIQKLIKYQQQLKANKQAAPTNLVFGEKQTPKTDDLEATQSLKKESVIHTVFNAVPTSIYLVNSSSTSLLTQQETVNFLKICQKVLKSLYVQDVILIGQDPLTLLLSQFFQQRGYKIIHLQPRSSADVLLQPTSKPEAQTEHISAGTIHTTSLANLGSLLPDYTRPESDFRQKEYVTFMYPNCEHGLAIFIKLVMLMKQRQPELKFLLLHESHQKLPAQLQLLHTVEQSSLFSLKPNLSNLKIMTQPEHFSKIWAQTKILLNFSPKCISCHGLTLEARYNYVPVIATKVEGEASVADYNLEIPYSTMKDVTCLPEDAEIEPYVQALEQLLQLSYETIKTKSDRFVSEYLQQEHLKPWLDLLNSTVDPKRMRPDELVPHLSLCQITTLQENIPQPLE